MNTVTQLDTALRAVAPIEGVSIGRKDDKTTWRIDFLPEATDVERAAAAGVVTNFDVAGEELREAQEKARRLAIANAAHSNEVLTALKGATNVQVATFIDGAFPDSTVTQRALLKFLLRHALSQVEPV